MFDEFKKIVLASKTKEEAFEKIMEIHNVPMEVSIAFRKKYDPERNLTPKKAFDKFYKEVKGELKK